MVIRRVIDLYGSPLIIAILWRTTHATMMWHALSGVTLSFCRHWNRDLSMPMVISTRALVLQWATLKCCWGPGSGSGQGWTGHLAYRASSRWAVDPMWAGPVRYVFFFFFLSKFPPIGPANWLQRASSVLPASTHIIGLLFVIVNQSWADRLREP